MNRFRKQMEGLGFFLILALLLEAVSRAKWVSPLYFPPVSKDGAVFIQLVLNGVLPLEVLTTLFRMGCGYGLAVLAMIPLGVGMGISRKIGYLFDPLIEILRPLPPPAIIPIVMLFLGIGNGMKIVVVCFACAFPILINTIDGVRRVHPILLNTARSFGLSHFQMVIKVIFPAALPQIVSGLRTALPIALIVAILSEMIGSVNGIGHFILRMQRTFHIPEMYAGIMMLGLTGYGLNKIFFWLDKTVLHWFKGWKQSV